MRFDGKDAAFFDEGYGLLVSGYADTPESPGIHLFRMSKDGRSVSREGSSSGVQNPSFSAIEGHCVYAASESTTCGRLAAFAIGGGGVGREGGSADVSAGASSSAAANASISFVNKVEVDGEEETCHVLKHPTKPCLYGANYQSGSIMSCFVEPEGSLGKTLPLVKHHGHGPGRAFEGLNHDRQLAAHIHTLSIVPGTKLLAAVDLGLDCIVLYKLDSEGRITSSDKAPVVSRWRESSCRTIHPQHFETPRIYGNDVAQIDTDEAVAVFETTPEAVIEAPLGSGPRILAYHPTEPYAALICELSCEVVLYRIDVDKRRWDAVAKHDLTDGSCGTIEQERNASDCERDAADCTSDAARTSNFVNSTHEKSTAPSLAAHLEFTPDGKRLYASTRGVDTITAFDFDTKNGVLEHIGSHWTAGAGPRHFAISPDGAFLAVANQLTDNVVVFSIEQNGTLEKTCEFNCPSPSCVVWHDGLI